MQHVKNMLATYSFMLTFKH